MSVKQLFPANRTEWLFPCAGALIGWLAWHPGASQLWLLALPLVWGVAPNRTSAAWVWKAYFLAGARDVPAITGIFFPTLPLLVGLLIWGIHATLLTLPWWFAWAEKASSRIWRTGLALCVLTIPPLGIIGWLSPLLIAGELFPGTGWLGLALTTGVLCFLTGIQAFKYQLIGSVCLLISTLAISLNLIYTPPELPERWVAIDTHLGRYPDQNLAAYQRHQQLITAVKTALIDGEKVIILPEEVLGPWRPAVQYWWKDVFELAATKQATLLLGADMFDERGERFKDVAIKIEKQHAIPLSNRVPMPIGAWRPGFKSSAIPDVFGSGIHTVADKRVALSVCYEDFLIYPFLLAMPNQPELIVSMASNWFATDMAAIWIQEKSITNQARLFGLPILRALNSR